MATSIPSHATPVMLKWAREQDGISLEDVASALKLNASDLQAWEEGRGTPSLAVLRSLAERYKRTLPTFYLEGPRQPFGIVRDFRTLPLETARSFSTALRRAIRVAQERQYWASCYLQEEGANPSPIVGAIDSTSDSVTTADWLRNALGVAPASQAECESLHDKYVFWRRACERAGVFVFQASRVPLSEMRGCSLPDNYAPAVLINSKEDDGPRCFTIIHEVAHILLGEGGVSGAGERLFSLSPNAPTERFCNDVAAEVLVPMQDFKAHVPNDWRTDEQGVYAKLTRRYGVSHSVIALRLLAAGLASRDYVDEKLSGAIPRRRRTEKLAIPQERLAIGRVGESFARMALSAFHGGEIHGGELSSLLAMKLQHLPRLEEAVYPHSVHPNWS